MSNESTKSVESMVSAGFEISPVTEMVKALSIVETEPEEPKLSAETIRRATDRIGRIQISFPEFPDSTFEGRSDFPLSYRTLSSKERLLLLFAENFRQQYSMKFRHRKPLVLAVCNECGVQKFVSTSIRASYFLFPELIRSWQQCAAFVADFIHYEPLQDQTAMVS